MSLKCEEPIDEFTAQVWILYHHQNFKYCTLLAGRNYGQTKRQTDARINKQTQGRSDLEMPCRTFQEGGIKI